MNGQKYVAGALGYAFVVSLTFPCCAWAQNAGTTEYQLNPGSTYQIGCYPPCLCPISASFNLRGTFNLSFVNSDPLFEHYAVTDIDWTVLMLDAALPELSIAGSGTYRIGGEFVLMHQLQLDLQADNTLIQHFDSGLIIGGTEFPDISIAISVNNMFCYDTVIVVNASPTGACCSSIAGDPNSACTVTTQIECVNQDGAYQGNGTTCPSDSTVPCAAPTGACCSSIASDPNGACAITTQTECVNQGGAYQGNGTTCPSDSTVPCATLCPISCPLGQECFSGCGELVQGVECVLFQADFGGLFILSNLGGFNVGDRVSVLGCHNPFCMSICMQGDGCLENTTIEPCGRICGGFAGIPCNVGEFCKLGIGECCCDFQGICTPIPEACLAVYDPVCGCDGMTYGNECEADAVGVSIDHPGECNICNPASDGSGCVPLGCSPIPEDQCIATVLHLNNQTGAITTIACTCMDFNLCHVEFGNATPFPVGNCPDGGTCEVFGTDTDNDGIDDQFTAHCVQAGACCVDIDDGPISYDTCLESNEISCNTDGGIFHGINTACTGVQACCLSFVGGGFCTDMNPWCCSDSGGVPQGPGSACTNVVGQGGCPQVCGGIAGIPCAVGEFCKFGIGECCCDFQGICTPNPDACTAVYDPVCGCDGVTYGNECEADAAGVSIDHPGECGVGACCSTFNDPSPAICTITTAEVCLASGGIFQGTNTTCSLSTCNCCFVDGSCTTMPAVVCAAGDGTIRQGPAIPAVSVWGLIVITLLMLTAGTLVLARQRLSAA